MRELTLGLILSLLMLDPVAALGCGDKFQRVGRGARFQRGYVALHPACILLYARPQSPIASTLRELEPALKRAGHKALVVDRPEELAPALQTGHYNVVMTDLTEVKTVEQEFRGLAVAPAILPMLNRPTNGDKKQAEAAFGCFVQSPGKQMDVLAEIDGLLERQIKSGILPASPPRK